MNRLQWMLSSGTLLVGVGLGQVAGCGLFEVGLDLCSRYPGDTCGTAGTGGTSSASSSTGSSGGSGGSGGATPAGCVPNENADPVADSCGVFVSSSLGQDANAGTKDAPLRTLGAALALAKGKPVYACGETFAETLAIGESATLYGALDCANGWVYASASRTQLTSAKADEIVLTVTKATTSAEVMDFAFHAANATKDGGSSIAVLVAQATVTFSRCDVTADDGRAGLDGVAYADAAPAGADGKAGVDACVAPTSFGGGAVTNTCGTGESIGGSGGIGDVPAGGNAADGLFGTTVNGGKGEGTGACTGGTKGEDGGAGTSGTGATGFGTLSATGYVGVSGGDGGPGLVAQGGGGGGGAKGGSGTGKCSASTSAGGASGGSGASGGCGGLGGKGGSAGGASIAIVSLDAKLAFSSVMVKTGSGGAGGDGGLPQAGGAGGTNGGAGGKSSGSGTLKDGCAGGKGGKGGDGGRGGGGAGGHSLGIASTGRSVPTLGMLFTTGIAGKGGSGDTAIMGDGAPGMAGGCWDVEHDAACK